uniref:Uncharacterized protein n=1 Tax=Anguilla anguilla TaxID=7936 RepID=A0A0E9VXQ4_ANGAN
MGVGVKCRRA